MAFIPVGTNYHVDVNGSVYKQVICEACQTSYCYRMQRDALATATSWLWLNNKGAEEAAYRRAIAKLEKQLAAECDPIPCPNCGWFQEHMLPAARKQYMPWMRGLGRLILAPSIPMLFVSSCVTTPSRQLIWTNPLGLAGSLLLLFGVGLIVVRITLTWRFNPNHLDQHKRINFGKRKTLSAEEFKRIMNNTADGANSNNA